MKKWYMIIDVSLCENCNCCFLACKDEYVGNRHEGYSEEQPLHGQRWINIMTKERGHGSLMDVAYLTKPCMHCDDPACMKKAGKDAVYKRKDGIVMIDPVKAKGNRDLVKACPYGAIWWNDVLDVPQKCTFCAHLLDEGHSTPRCAQACPTGALEVIKAGESEMKEIITNENLEVLNPEFGTRPRVYYKNLHRFFDCFIAGSVAYMKNEAKECAGAAKVSLLKNGELVGKNETDYFGDFKFDNIPPKSGMYSLEIEFELRKTSIAVDLVDSVYLEEILI